MNVRKSEDRFAELHGWLTRESASRPNPFDPIGMDIQVASTLLGEWLKKPFGLGL
jgi:hypothetical protein